MREASTKLVYELAKNDTRVMALTADGRNAVYEQIKAEMPNQYIDYGIAEQNMVASAAGLASCGKIPFIFGTSNFLAMRAFEFIRNDVCIPNMNVKFLGIFSGLSRTSWGATHQGTEELALLRCLPNIQVITPSTPIMAREATRWAYKHSGPVYIRLEASGETEHYADNYVFSLGKSYVIKKTGEYVDLTLATMGSIIDLAIDISSALEDKGVSVAILDIPTTKPIDKELIADMLKRSKSIITIEEHSIYGGLGSAVAEVIAETGISIGFRRIGLDGCAKGCGSRESVRTNNGISKRDIICAFAELARIPLSSMSTLSI